MRRLLVCIVVAIFANLSFYAVNSSGESDAELLICEEDQVRCEDNSGCYLVSRKCDAFTDCSDGSDEVNCDHDEECTNIQFKCVSSGQCISNLFVCDASNDCDDGSDENECETECYTSSDFMCVSDKMCINGLLRCDGTSHCVDASDEENCTEARVEHVPVLTSASDSSSCDGDNVFHCSEDYDGQCIASDLRCDGTQDCDNGADEDDAVCSDQQEEDADADSENEIYSCEDHGEWCAQTCENDADTGYSCGCHDGYVLSEDKHSCVTDEVGYEYLWLVNGNSVVKPNVDVPLDVGKQIDAIDYDFAGRKLFWLSSFERSINRMNEDGSDSNLLLSTDDERPVALAFDWVHNNLYWCTAYKIEVLTLPRRLRYVVLTELQLTDVRTLVVDPRPDEGFIYWGEGGYQSGIYRSGLDGSHVEQIVRANVNQPTAMTLDFASGTGKLLWLDSTLHHIMSWDVATRTTKIWFSITDNNSYLTGLAVFTDFVYWAEQTSGKVYAADKSSIRYDYEQDASVIYREIASPKTVLVHHQLKQPAGDNVCASNNGGCSHVCLPSPAASSMQARCFCPQDGVDVFRLDSDNQTCIVVGNSEATVSLLMTDVDGETEKNADHSSTVDSSKKTGVNKGNVATENSKKSEMVRSDSRRAAHSVLTIVLFHLSIYALLV